MRRLFGSRGSGSRQDALLTEEAVGPRVSDKDLDILAARRVGGGEKGGSAEEGW